MSTDFSYGFNVNLRVNNYTGAIQWWHNGTAITGSTAKYTLVPSSSTLQINNVEFSDAGIYQAELLDGTLVRQFSIFDVTVIGKCSKKHTQYMEQPQNVRMIEHVVNFELAQLVVVMYKQICSPIENRHAYRI